LSKIISEGAVPEQRNITLIIGLSAYKQVGRIGLILRGRKRQDDLYLAAVSRRGGHISQALIISALLIETQSPIWPLDANSDGTPGHVESPAIIADRQCDRLI
jgi:hypothetical protein